MKRHFLKYGPRIFILFFIVMFLLPNFVSAQGAFEKITGICNFIASPISCTLSFIRNVEAGLISMVGGMLDPMLHEDVPNKVVTDAWNISRNFANMLFIVTLIIMAFATIFSIGGYDYRSMIARFIVAALLINFSLVIGEMIIGWSQSLTNVFLQAIGSVGDRLGQGAKIGQQFETILTTNGAADWTIGSASIAIVANIIFLFILLESMFVLLFFAVIRIPVLWLLLIISPLAWIMSVLPSTRKYHQMWWDHFISWNLFMPVYLFFLYLGFMFLGNQEAVLAIPSPSNIPELGQAGTIQTLFFYIFIALLLNWGAKTARSLSSHASNSAWTVWATGRATAAKSALWRGTGIPGVWKSKRKEWKEEGYRVPFTDRRILGEQQLREREAKLGSSRIATALGLQTRGVELQQQREFMNKTERELKDIQDKFDVRKIDDNTINQGAGVLPNGSLDPGFKGSAKDPKVYAYRKMLAKLGRLSPDLYSKTLEELSDSPLAAKDFAQAGKETKYSNLSGKDLIEMTTGLDSTGAAVYSNLDVGNLIPAKKEQARFIESDQIIRSGLSQDQFNRLVGILGGHGTADGKNFIKDVGENRPDLSVEYTFARNTAGAYTNTDLRDKTIRGYAINTAGKTDAQVDDEIRERHYAGVMTSGAKNLALMPIELDPTKPPRTWNRPEFLRGLETHISSFPAGRARGRFLTSIESELQNIKNPIERAEKKRLFHDILTRLGIPIP